MGEEGARGNSRQAFSASLSAKSLPAVCVSPRLFGRGKYFNFNDILVLEQEDDQRERNFDKNGKVLAEEFLNVLSWQELKT